jgi:DNA-binding MarR family transcriptional regulator
MNNSSPRRSRAGRTLDIEASTTDIAGILPRPKGARRAVSACREIGGLAVTANYDVLYELLGFWIRRAQVKVLRSFARHLEQYELSPTEVAALILMGANEGLSQIALASALDADQSTVVNMLVSLERRNMMSRVRLPKDRRYQVLSLTPAGTETVQRIKSVLAQHNQALQEKLSADERKALLVLLRRFVES